MTNVIAFANRLENLFSAKATEPSENEIYWEWEYKWIAMQERHIEFMWEVKSKRSLQNVHKMY